jgi:hypothetical protein
MFEMRHNSTLKMAYSTNLAILCGNHRHGFCGMSSTWLRFENSEATLPVRWRDDGWMDGSRRRPPIRSAGLAAPEAPEGSMKLRRRIDFCVENRSHEKHMAN